MRLVDAASVPVIDLAPARAAAADRLRVAAAIDAACREIGFFAIDGHGVPARVVDELRAVAHAFFAMPREDKLAARHPVAGTNRGYHPVGGEALSSANDEPAPPDLKEFFHVGPVDVGSDAYYTSAEGCRHFTPNVWPATTPTRFVVNIGDLLMRWTNDRWLSNMHRVVNPPAGDGRPRLSIAFFNHPNYDVTIECLASQGPARHPPVRSGDYRDLKYAKTGFTVYVRGPDMAPHTPQRSSRPE